MTFLLDDNLTYDFKKFDTKNGEIHLKDTDKIIKKENILKFVHIFNDEEELKKQILNWKKEPKKKKIKTIKIEG